MEIIVEINTIWRKDFKFFLKSKKARRFNFLNVLSHVWKIYIILISIVFDLKGLRRE